MNELIEYIKNTESDIANFNLGDWYEKQKHLSPACSFYLRCAELTQSNLLAYECLLRLYTCYRELSNRDYTCENLLKNALSLCPKNPEAYFLLSQFYEYKGSWMDSYLYASISLNLLSNFGPSGMKKNFGYESKYMLLFQKAVSSWGCGKSKEARRLFREIKDSYHNELSDLYLRLVQNNLSSLGMEQNTL